jgi:hypothetical protein
MTGNALMKAQGLGKMSTPYTIGHSLANIIGIDGDRSRGLIRPLNGPSDEYVS